jgi:small subunit ribosomal protein S3
MRIRKYISEHLPHGAMVSSVEIERTGTKINILIKTAKPGILIGKKGEGIEKLRKDLGAKINGQVHINVEEIRKPEMDSVLVAESVAQQLEKRVMFRRAMKRAIASALRQGAKGIKIAVAGRLGGAEIARTEWYREGRVPLHTLRADVDYGTAEAKTTYGIIGVKVWIFKGEVIGDPREKQAQEVTA